MMWSLIASTVLNTQAYMIYAVYVYMCDCMWLYVTIGMEWLVENINSANKGGESKN